MPKHKVTNLGDNLIRVYFSPGTSSQLLGGSEEVEGEIHKVVAEDPSERIRYAVDPVE